MKNVFRVVFLYFLFFIFYFFGLKSVPGSPTYYYWGNPTGGNIDLTLHCEAIACFVHRWDIGLLNVLGQKHN